MRCYALQMCRTFYWDRIKVVDTSSGKTSRVRYLQFIYVLISYKFKSSESISFFRISSSVYLIHFCHRLFFFSSCHIHFSRIKAPTVEKLIHFISNGLSKCPFMPPYCWNIMEAWYDLECQALNSTRDKFVCNPDKRMSSYEHKELLVSICETLPKFNECNTVICLCVWKFTCQHICFISNFFPKIHTKMFVRSIFEIILHQISDKMYK